MSKFFRTTVSFSVCKKDEPFGVIGWPPNLVTAMEDSNCKVVTTKQYTEEVSSLDAGLTI